MTAEIQDAVALAKDLAEFRPDSGDVELEAAINIEWTILIESETKARRVAAFERFAQIIRQRRPEMVEYLERVRGLRR